MMVHEKGRWDNNNGSSYCSNTSYWLMHYVPYFAKIFGEAGQRSQKTKFSSPYIRMKICAY